MLLWLYQKPHCLLFRVKRARKVIPVPSAFLLCHSVLDTESMRVKCFRLGHFRQLDALDDYGFSQSSSAASAAS